MGAIEQERWQALCDIEPIRGDRVPPGRALSMPELGRLLSRAGANDRKWRGVRNQAILALLYAAGLRRAELAHLMLGDVQTHAAGRLRVRVMGKGNKERLVPLPPWANPYLTEWIRARGNAPGRLFLKRLEGPQPWPGMGPEAVRELILRTVRLAEIAHVAPHDFRRTYISLLLDTSRDVSAVQKLAGHANVKTTLRYDRRNERAAEAAADHLPPPLPAAS
jgi:site-specific recombinase XerD